MTTHDLVLVDFDLDVFLAYLELEYSKEIPERRVFSPALLKEGLDTFVAIKIIFHYVKYYFRISLSNTSYCSHCITSLPTGCRLL